LSCANHALVLPLDGLGFVAWWVSLG